MAVVIFLLGRPGSGKSKIARCIKGSDLLTALNLEERCLSGDWTIEYISDYYFLLEMFREEQAAIKRGQAPSKRQFCLGDPELGGFNVIDFSVLKRVLEIVKEHILAKIQNSQTVILVEFARKNYMEAFEQLGWESVKDAYFLYFEVEFRTCVQRIKERTVCEMRTDDDNFVTDDIMKNYYEYDDHDVLKKYFDPQKLRIIPNNGELKETWIEVKDAVQKWCLAEPETGSANVYTLVERVA